MKTVCILILALLCLAANAIPQPFILSSSYATLPEVRKAVEGKRSFSLPGFRSTLVYAEGIVSADLRILSLSGVSLKTGDVYVEADGLEYNWDLREAKLTGSAKVLGVSRPSGNN